MSDWLPKYIEANFSRSIPISAKAIDESTGKVVGISVAVVIDPKQPKLPMMMDFLEPASQPIMHQIRVFLDEIDEGLGQLSLHKGAHCRYSKYLTGLNAAELLGIKSLTTDRDPRILDNLLVSVDKKYWNKSIGTELIRKNVEYAKKDKECLAAKVRHCKTIYKLVYLYILMQFSCFNTKGRGHLRVQLQSLLESWVSNGERVPICKIYESRRCENICRKRTPIRDQFTK